MYPPYPHRVYAVFVLSTFVLIRVSSDNTNLYRRVPCKRREKSGDNLTTAVMFLNGPWSELCCRTVIDAHGQPRHKFSCSRTLYGCPWTLFRGPSRILQASRTFTDQSRSLNFPKMPCFPHEAEGNSRTFHDLQGSTRRFTAATRFPCWNEPDMIRFDLASLLDSGFRSLMPIFLYF